MVKKKTSWTALRRLKPTQSPTLPPNWTAIDISKSNMNGFVWSYGLNGLLVI